MIWRWRSKQAVLKPLLHVIFHVSSSVGQAACLSVGLQGRGLFKLERFVYLLPELSLVRHTCFFDSGTGVSPVIFGV